MPLSFLTPAWEDTDQIIGYFLPKLSVHEHFFHSVGQQLQHLPSSFAHFGLPPFVAPYLFQAISEAEKSRGHICLARQIQPKEDTSRKS